MRRPLFAALTVLIALALMALAQTPPGGATRAGGKLDAAIYSAGGALEPMQEVIVPLILRKYPLVPGSAWSTTVVIQNATDSPAAVILKYRDSAGDVALSLSDTLPPRGSRRYNQDAVASLGDSFVGTLVITSEQSLAAVVYAREPTWGDGLVSLTPRDGGATVYYAPRVLNGLFGWTSRLAVANRGDLATSVTIEFYSNVGDLLVTHSDTLVPHASAVYDPAAIAGLPGGLNGSSMAVIHSEQPLEGAVLHLHPGSALASGSSLPDRPELSFYLPSLARGYSNHVATSSYGLWNPGAREATVTASFYDTAGRGLVADVFSVPPAMQKSTFLGADPSLPDGFIGSAVVTSDEPVVADVSEMLTLPVASMAYSGISRTAPTLYAPSLRRSPTAHTTLTVQNASSQAISVTLSYYDQGGVLVARQTDTLPAYSSHIYDQSQTALGEDFSGSAVISGEGPLAAMVHEYRQVEGNDLTPTPTATPTPESTPTVGPGGQRIFLPLVQKSWPPLPTQPMLHDISIGECNDNNYQVSWEAAVRAVNYALQEDDHPAFSSPATVYHGPNTSYYLDGKTEGTYYYRVRGTNEWGGGPWSQTKSVTVGPPMTLWTIVNDTGGDLTVDIHGVASRSFPPGEHTWCVPSGEHTYTARGWCGSTTGTLNFEPYGRAPPVRFWCGSARGLMTTSN